MLRNVPNVIEMLSPDQNATLDRWSGSLQGVLRAALDGGGPAAGRLKNWLNGVWLGHPLHPALTDLTLGAWSTGALLDLVNARGAADAATTVGVLSALPTALAGAADWSDTEDESRREGLVHALLNSVGLTCMIASLFARRGGQRGLGILLSTLGLSLASVSAWIGGHLVYALGSNVSRQSFEPTATDFTVVARADTVEADKPVAAELEVGGQSVPLVLVKRGAIVTALAATCTHWGASLAEGKLVEGDCIECPWHGSRFRLSDGGVKHGPASVPARAYEVRIRDGNVEVRRPV